MLTGNLKGDAVAFMSRHFIAMSCDYEVLGPDGTVLEKKVAVFSGFFLELHGIFFWVTAGHCLKDGLDEPLATGIARIIEGSFLDAFGHEATHFHSIPYRYEPGCGLYLEIPEQGVDFALIPLNSLLVQAFLANKIVPISRHNWIHQPQLTFEFYRMLGIPRSEVYTTIDDHGRLETQVRQVMIALDRIGLEEVGESPAGADTPSTPSEQWFIGRIDPDSQIRDIVGMSGGPIYGFRHDDNGNLVYHVVALQSRWWAKTRTIFGCSLPYFAEEVHRRLGAAIEELSEFNKPPC